MAWVGIPTLPMCVIYEFCLPSFEPRPKNRELKCLSVIGSVAERSKSMVLGTSHFDRLGSNPNPAKCVFFTNFVYLPLNRGPKIGNCNIRM